jgi:hypothetical protein
LAVEDAGPPIGADTTVSVFDKTLFDSDHRHNSKPVTLPSGLFQTVTLHIALDCPGNRCDPWDRLGSLALFNGPPSDAGVQPTIEFARFMTTYGVKGAWDLDVTDLQPLLRGDQTVQGFIDTWVKQGGPGNGWLLSVSLIYKGGVPTPEPVAVVPIAGWQNFDVGDPAKPIAQSVPPQPLTLPDGASSVSLRVLVTGHGQGNSNYCAEFCSLDHHVTVNGTEVTKHTVWKDDCDQNPINNQQGTWDASRAGWCPGMVVTPWTAPLGSTPSSFTVGYSIDDYVNTCSPQNCNASTCVYQTACAYDGGAHTSPFYAFSALLIGYR